MNWGVGGEGGGGVAEGRDWRNADWGGVVAVVVADTLATNALVVRDDDRATVRTFHTRTASPCRVSNQLISQSDCPRRDDTLGCEELAAQRRREGNFNFAGRLDLRSR